MKKKSNLFSKIAIITAAVGIGSFIYKKVKECKYSCDTNDSECCGDDSSFEIILDDITENNENLTEKSSDKKEISTEESLENENKDA